jgi:hypothetical protein
MRLYSAVISGTVVDRSPASTEDVNRCARPVRDVSRWKQVKWCVEGIRLETESLLFVLSRARRRHASQM